MRRLLGVLALVFGTVGAIASMVGAIVVWPVIHFYADKAAVLSADVVHTVALTQDLLQPFESRIQEVTTRVTNVRQSATAVARGGDQSDPADLAKVETILAELSSRLDQAQDWTTSLKSSATSLHSITKLASAVTFDPQQQEKLQTAISALENVDTALDQVDALLRRASQEQDLQTRARHLAIVASALEGPLSELNGTVAEVSAFLSTAQEEATKVQRAVSVWRTALPLISTVVLIWVAIGQVCLLRRGWFMSRSPEEDAG
jgi:hypothetical protein